MAAIAKMKSLRLQQCLSLKYLLHTLFCSTNAYRVGMLVFRVPRRLRRAARRLGPGV
jgi:hypothetical protein